VFSGHPLRTTLGNSFRVYYYVKFILHLSNITFYKIFVCGDDTLLILEKADRTEFEKHFWDVYAEPAESYHGLG
jgi:hypothetical protein